MNATDRVFCSASPAAHSDTPSEANDRLVLMGRADLGMDCRHRLAQVVLKPVDINPAALRKTDSSALGNSVRKVSAAHS